MLWSKRKYSFKLRGGKYSFSTDALRGTIQHVMVIPKHNNTVWSMEMIDPENDVVFNIRDWEGRLDDKSGLAVGLASLEKLNVNVYDSTHNDSFDVIFKIKELE